MQTAPPPIANCHEYAWQAERQNLLARLAELEASQAELKARQRLENAAARVAVAMRWQPDDTLDGWGQRILEALTDDLNLLQSTLYSRDTDSIKACEVLTLGASCGVNQSTVRRRIAFGDGPLGQVAQSGKTLYLDAAADIQLQTHTGIANLRPQSLLMQPLVFNNNVEGALELAGLRPLDPTERELVSRVSEGLAVGLMSIRSQEVNKRLLREADEQRQQIVSQEEEMRQNVEEMQATQEEMRRVQTDLQAERDAMQRILRIVPNGIVRVERGKYADVNDSAIRLLGHQTREDLIGRKALEDSAEVQPCGRPSDVAIAAHVAQAIAEGQANFEWMFKRPDGSEWLAEATLVQAETLGGAPMLRFSIRDVSEERARLSALHTRIAELEAALSAYSAPDAAGGKAIRSAAKAIA